MTVLSRSGDHAVVHIQPGLWQIVFHFPVPTNCWLWQESDGLTLVDAGYPWSTRQILDATERLGHPLKRIVITHAHPDHAGCAGELAARTGALVFAHAADIPYLQGGNMSAVPGHWLCRAVLKTGQYLGILNAPRISKVEAIGDGGMVGRLKVLHTPGHTPGSISLWAEEPKAIFCGDNICNRFSILHLGVPWFTLDLAEQRASLSSYTKLPVELLLSGHGPAYRGDVAHRVQQLMETPISVFGAWARSESFECRQQRK
jgi:glyoxylase-like metal-dependent hydrolase (beta-lactamase superfamily II)